MAGWRKAWLAVLERGGGGGGGGGGPLHVHLHGLHSSSSFSSCSYYKRSGSGGGGSNRYNYNNHINKGAVLAGVCLLLVLAFFYISVANGPTADTSFPSLSWFSSSSSPSPPLALPRKVVGRRMPPHVENNNDNNTSSLTPHPLLPPTPTTQQSNASAENSVTTEIDSIAANFTEQPMSMTRQSEERNSSQNVNSTSIGSDRESVIDGINFSSTEQATPNSSPIGELQERIKNTTQQQQQEAIMPVPPLQSGHEGNSSRNATVGALGVLKDGIGDSTEQQTLQLLESNYHQGNSSKNITIGSGGGARKVDTQSQRTIRYKYPRRQKEIFHSAQEANAKHSNYSGAKASQKIRRAVGTSDDGMYPFGKCDIFNGRWVRDESYPFYPPGSCPHIDIDFDCHKNGRPDNDFLKWRWLPFDCDIPRLNATDFLERLRGKRIIFVGDSLNRNMWESLVCILRHSVSNKTSVYEASGRSQFKTRGYYSFKFKDYKCSVDFVRSIFLVKELIRENRGSPVDHKLKLDELDGTTLAYRGADMIVFNTGHWWTHSKTSRGANYYQEGNHVYRSLEVMDAFKKALTTWARWVDKNIDSRRTQVVFRGYSLTHFRGGQWNSGGKCHKETEPIFNQSYLTQYPSKMRALEQILRQMKTPVIYLNISRLTDYRKDAHPSMYRMRYNTAEEQIAAVRRQDCSHWCLPGVPDTWNELLYASLLKAGKGSWRL